MTQAKGRRTSGNTRILPMERVVIFVALLGGITTVHAAWITGGEKRQNRWQPHAPTFPQSISNARKVYHHPTTSRNNHPQCHTTTTATTTSTLFASTPTQKSSGNTGSSSSSSSSSSFNRATSQLVSTWAPSVGIQQSPVLQLESDATTGLGWKISSTATTTTKTPVAANDLLLQVPSNVALTVESPGSGPNYAPVLRRANDRTAFRKLPWYVQFSAYFHVLKQETTDNSSSSTSTNDSISYQPWLASLPRRLDTPIHWTDAEVQDCQYDFLTKAVAQQKATWRTYHEQLRTNGFADLSWDDFVHGCEMARSRAFSGAFTGSGFNPRVYAFTLLLVAVYVGLGLGTIEQAANGAGVVFCAAILQDFVLPKLFKSKKYVICPLMDLANHKSVGATAVVSFEYFSNAYSLAATQDLPAGTDVCISYGPRSNDQWLQYYGFCESSSCNPNDVYVMPPLREWPLAEMEAAAGRTVAPGRLQALERAGLLGYTQVDDKNNNDDDDAASSSSSSVFDEQAANADGGVVVTRSVGLDPAVWQALRALFCTDAEWQAAGQAVGSFAEASSSSSATETAVRAAAQCALTWELDRKATTVAEDEALWQRLQSAAVAKKKAADTMSTAERLALQFRIEKKKVLQECLQSFV